jgi:CRISPR-associated protein Csb2
MTKRERVLFERTVPDRLLDALRIESSELQAVGWSAPPGARFITYQRPYDCFASRPARRSSRNLGSYRWVRLALSGRPLPRIQDSVEIAELVRKAALNVTDRAGTEIPAALSGHGVPEGNRHGHAFFLPEDSDGDGRIDHVLIVTELGLPARVVDAISQISKIWEPDGAEWPVLFEGAGVEESPASSYLSASHTWISVTPYLHPWFAKRSFGHVEQLKRECRERGIPEPVSVALLENIDVGGGRQLRAVQFRRIRSKRGLRQPDRLGRLLRLEFAEPVAGPVALGFGCHFGLGLFRPD